MAESIAMDLFTEVIKETAQSTKKNGFMGLLSNNSITLTNLLFSGVVVGLELLLNSQVFDCPIDDHKMYGTVFIVAPFSIVFITNLVILGEVWKLSDRCCVKKYRQWGERGSRVVPAVLKALFGPTVWLIASFVDTEHYVCLRVGQPIEKRNLTNETLIKALELEFAAAKSTSHMLAWLLFAILVFATAIAIIARKCCLKDNVLLEDDYTIERREAISALLTFRQLTRNTFKEKDVETGKQTPKTNDSGKKSREEETNADSEAIVRVPESITREDKTKKDKKNLKTQKEKEGKSFLSRAGDSLNSFLYGDEKDRGKDEGRETTGRFLGNEEEIVLYPNGVPEQFGKKRVEKLFENWLEKNDWHYSKAREEFTKMYPRIASGKPKEPWISDSIRESNVLKREVGSEETGEDNDKEEERRNKESKKKEERKDEALKQEVGNEETGQDNNKEGERRNEESGESEERKDNIAQPKESNETTGEDIGNFY